MFLFIMIINNYDVTYNYFFFIFSDTRPVQREGDGSVAGNELNATAAGMCSIDQGS